MNHVCHQPAFYKAITLTERLASLRAFQGTMPSFEVDAELAQRRLQRWRSQPPFTIGSYFAQRLALDSLAEDEFHDLLGEPIEAVADRFPATPSWLEALAQAFSCPTSVTPIPLPEALRGHDVLGFLEAIEPLISQARERVHQGVKELLQTRPDPPFDPESIGEVLFANLPWQLSTILSRTMVLELNVARLQGLLEGDTAEARFRTFLERVRQRENALSLLEEYPVLSRQLIVCLDHWSAYSLEFLRHLCADWGAIQATFNSGGDAGVLVQAATGAGDTHRGGRSVLIAKFSSGFHVVYKPKSLAVEVHFQELLSWLNERGVRPPFRTLKVLDRESYGWVEFISARSCTSAAEVQRFYQRQGGYLALLYALEATDFHFENLIAHGEDPVLIDLEALFHPRMSGIDPDPIGRLAVNTISDSVLRTGLLPQRIWENAESEGIDISGLGARPGQLSPQPVPCWEGAGTDEMRLARKRMAMPGRHNRPSLNGTEVDTQDYLEAIAIGFTDMYKLLLTHRDELLSDDGPLARFAEDEVRVVLRPTQTYAVMLSESYHPDVLRDALDRDRLFERLWVEVEHLPYLAKVISAEREDLLEGDVPIFTTRPCSRDLWSSSNAQIPHFFDEPGMSLAQRRLRQLGEADLAQQLWFIRASLATLSMGMERTNQPSYRLTVPQTVAGREQLLAAARSVGDRLEALALRREHDASWIGLTLSNERYWSLLPLGVDLYDGLPGIALFLAYLGAITCEKHYTLLAHAALTTMRRELKQSRSFITSIGGFNGWGGVIYTLTHLGVLWDQPTLLREAEAAVELLPPLIDRDEYLDTIAGAAGCIGSLISLYRCAPSDRTLAAALRCGDRLILHAQPMERGIGWVTPMARTKALGGFSHGAAGMTWALLELFALTSEERFRTAAQAALDYERSLFSPEVENWRDLREPATTDQGVKESEDQFVTAWCHGAPGIGLARLRGLQYVDDAAIRAEIATALKTTLAHGFGLNHSLCHGDLGNLEFLLQASQELDDQRLQAEVNRIASAIVESINRDGWLCGIPLGVESPGLMTGLAGIGYGLLRLADSKQVPSVLVLAPPVLDASGGERNK